MGIKKGAWVGLMLGNVPDFVILTLALSKLDAAIVPIDPDDRRPRARAHSRAGAAARAGHPPAWQRGSISANGTSAPVPPSPCPARASAADRAAGPAGAAAAADAAEVRRRLQGTLLTCSVYKRNPPDHGVEPDRGAVHRRLARRSQGRPAHRQEHRGRGRARRSPRSAMNDKTNVSSRCRCSTPTAGTSASCRRCSYGATMFLEEELSATPHRQAPPRARRRRPARHAVAVRRAGRSCRRPSRSSSTEPRFLAAGSRLDQTRRRRLPREVRRAHPQLLPHHRDRRDRARGHRQVSRDGRQADRGVEVRITAADGTSRRRRRQA